MIINCDMGEGIGNEEELMPYINAANIACGYHAGDEATMAEVARLCIKYDVAIGAHPSFPDRENFGRTEMHLPAEEVYHLVKAQVELAQSIAMRYGARLQHVKPHGALYNMAARDNTLAATIARAVKDIDPSLVYYGSSGSVMISEASALGLQTVSEVFADRTYQDDGSLTPRTLPNALLTDVNEVIRQVMKFSKENKVVTLAGKVIDIKADTICIHGDGAHAVQFAKAIHKALYEK
jgi:UPF0271 protein